MVRFCCSLAGLVSFLLGQSAAAEPPEVAKWQRWEHTFEAESTDLNPQTAQFTVTLTGPSGKQQTIDGFWDGGQRWKVRFMPGEEGTWQWQTAAVPAAQGLHLKSGRFECRPNQGKTIFEKHGPIEVSANGRYLQHADGTPWFWLADTAWNGALRSDKEDWSRYLQDRKQKNFTAIQLVTTQWRAAYENAEGQVAYTGRESIEIQPEFFQRIDERIGAVNDHGLLAAPVVLWALGDEEYTPGKLPTDQAIRLAKYIVARYGAHHVVWFLGGDENYGGNRAEHWKQIGRAVFGDRPHAPVTLHPQGMQWHFDAFADEKWLDFLIYQSGHGDDANALTWIHSGPAAQKWQQDPPRPVINSEPPYEDHVAYQSRKPHTAYNVRRASYWSLLSAPTAGVSYGAHGVWSWEHEPAVPLNHNSSGTAQPWHEAMQLPGSDDMGHLAELFTSISWWTLRPDRSFVVQLGYDPADFQAVAQTEDGQTTLIYTPVGGTIRFQQERGVREREAHWFNPRTGERTQAHQIKGGRYTTPNEEDWVLILTR